ncbi:MAG: ATP-binding protein [Bacteroidaceae bacterium]|nr:ATP-binding protein [Bacteroidaceae bacterium]MBO7588945.1 ATP-binding protein [Bacteroidaceae bacterium]MBP5646661.1 ATP-binding protein [Bacteroidaceae bacterium]
MENEYADGISRIEIDSLWGRKHIVWDLRPDVNILSGLNGTGKSTILNKTVARLDYLSGESQDDAPEVSIQYFPDGRKKIRYDVIRSIDRPLMHSNLLEKMSDRSVVSELDWQLYKLQRRYLDYQVNIGNRTINLLTSGEPEKIEEAQKVSRPRVQFMDFIDELFSDTGKKIVRSSNEILFDQFGVRLLPYSLSSGEKQLLVILLTLLVQDNQPYVLLMDEPEISLHIEWQQQLVSRVRDMNPNVQIIMTTHSPAVIMDGWMEAVTEVNDITVK